MEILPTIEEKIDINPTKEGEILAPIRQESMQGEINNDADDCYCYINPTEHDILAPVLQESVQPVLQESVQPVLTGGSSFAKPIMGRIGIEKLNNGKSFSVLLTPKMNHITANPQDKPVTLLVSTLSRES
nr:hypothetical protein Iba_chr02fCG10230 [Ipomoea batatas]